MCCNMKVKHSYAYADAARTCVAMVYVDPPNVVVVPFDEVRVIAAPPTFETIVAACLSSAAEINSTSGHRPRMRCVLTSINCGES